MEVRALPDDLITDKKIPEIFFHPYCADKPGFRTRAVMTTHAISLVRSGVKTMNFAEKKVTVDSNHIHGLSAGKCITSMEINKPFESILLFFSNQVLEEFKHKHGIHTNRKETSRFIHIPKTEFLRQYIGTVSELCKSGKFSHELTRLKFEELLLYLLEFYPVQTSAYLNSNETNKHTQIRAAMQRNIGENLPLDEIAFLCNMSLATFKREFQLIFGTTPGKWLQNQRMLLAKSLLEAGAIRPSDVYYKVGYRNHSSFSQAFKQTFRLSPREYQQSFLNR